MSPTLAELVDAYADADEAVKAAEDRRKDLRDQLLLISDESPEAGDRRDPLVGTRATVRVSTSTAWRLDSTRLKSEHPEIYAAYAKQSQSTRLTVSPR